jgi:hypothetical protein
VAAVGFLRAPAISALSKTRSEDEQTQSSQRRQGRSEDREAGLLDRLTVAIELLSRQPARPAETFKTPSYDGQGDVELFISQFVEVADANHWEAAATMLHLRQALKEGARDCGRAQSLRGIFTALRARYGLSPREARSKLNNLRRDSSTTLQEHASEVQRLVYIAYADLPRCNQTDMIIDTFCSTVGNAYLQRHLLAVATPTLEDAVRAGNEFLQIKVYSAKSSIRMVEEEMPEEPEKPVTQVSAASSTPAVESLLAPLTQLLQQLTDQLGKLQVPATVPGNPGRPPRREVVCWQCGTPGHVQRECSAKVTNRGNQLQFRRPGNGASPQQ